MKEVFIPQSRRGRDPDNTSYWRLLVVDGHGSHIQGDTQVTRAPFNVLYHRTRQEGLTAQYILAGWRRSGLHSLDARKVLEKPEVACYRVITPDLAPLEDEVQETTKSLRKQDDKRSWDTTEIFRARGCTAEETAGYIDILPNRALIYNVEEELSI